MENQSTQKLLPKLEAFRESLKFSEISEERKQVLTPYINFIQQKLETGEAINLNFICTHNSRRSQFSQLWGKTAAFYYNIPVNSFSGGVEVTAFNERAVKAVAETGFQVEKEGEGNPKYKVSFSADSAALIMFSKTFDDEANKVDDFAAIMTCAHADENCPFIPNASARIPVRYEDPKKFDDTPLETEKYLERSRQIATEMFFVFSQIKQ